MERKKVKSGGYGSPERANSLTEREHQVLLKAADGHTSIAIARLLNITERTVTFHLSGAYRKLGSRNRKEAIEAARKRCIV